METFYLPIMNRLEEQVPELATIDMDWGQLDEPAESYPVTFPCVLIDVPDISYERTGCKAQPGLAQVRITVGIEVIEDTHSGSGTAADAVERLKIAEKAHKALKGWDADGFDPLERVNRNIRNMYGIKVYTFTYESAVMDVGA
jgi:hypothetical protein